MIKITFINNDNSLSFVVKKIKIVIVRNLIDYWTIRKSVENNISKESKSEYSEEFNTRTIIKINDEDINKSSEILLVDSKFNLDEESKLGSKSLLLRYFSKITSENFISDEYLQLESMFLLLTDLLSDDLIEFQAKSLNYKLLAKIIETSFLKEGFKCNDLDITYEDNILFQLKLINKIVSLEKHYIVVIDIIRLTSSIYNFINKMDNCQVIVMCQFTDITINNVFIDGIDFEDDEALYERMNSMTNIYNLDEFKEKLKNQRLKTLK